MIGLSSVAVAAMARQEGQTDKKGHTVPPSVPPTDGDAAVG